MRQIIQLTRISKTYRSGSEQIVALDSLNLVINSGEQLAVTGPSGCGKSTLLNIIGCLERPTAGEYTLDETRVNALDETSRARLRLETFGFVFQRFCLIEELSVLENVELPLLYRGVRSRTKQSREALAAVGLADRCHERPSNLSGGQQQRVAIARALVGRPHVVLADEPTGNLDASSADTVMDLLLNSRQTISDAILIVVTHNLELASRLDRTVRLSHGTIADPASQLETAG